MADQKLSDLTAVSSPLADTDLIYVVRGGTSPFHFKGTVLQMKALFDAAGAAAAAAAASQPLDSDLTAIAALSATNDDVIQRKAGAWTNRTIAQLKTDLNFAAKSQSISLGFGANGGGSVITTGLRFAIVVQQACTITAWDIVADQSGSIVMDIRKGTPSAGAVTTSSITAAAIPALSSAQVAGSSTLTGWTTAVAAGDVLELVITGTPASVTRAAITLKATVTLA